MDKRRGRKAPPLVLRTPDARFTLEDFLSGKVFSDAESVTLSPDPADAVGFNAYYGQD